MPSCPKPTGWIRDAEMCARRDDDERARALAYPQRLPSDVSEADALEQFQPVEDDEDWRD